MSYPEPYCTLECLLCFLPSLSFYSVHQRHKHYHLLLSKCAIYSLAFVSSFIKAHFEPTQVHLPTLPMGIRPQAGDRCRTLSDFSVATKREQQYRQQQVLCCF